MKLKHVFLPIYFYVEFNSIAFSLRIHKLKQKMQQLNSDYLSFLERRELLEKYRSDLRKVEFERDYLLSLISRLEDELQIPQVTAQKATEITHYAAQPVVKMVKAAKPPKQVVQSSESRSSVKKSKASNDYDFKISKWDDVMIKALSNSEKPLNAGALLKAFENANKKMAEPLDDKQLRNALSRTFNKLANKRDTVRKQNFGGKGYLYSLNPNYK